MRQPMCWLHKRNFVHGLLRKCSALQFLNSRELSMILLACPAACELCKRLQTSPALKFVRFWAHAPPALLYVARRAFAGCTARILSSVFSNSFKVTCAFRRTQRPHRYKKMPSQDAHDSARSPERPKHLEGDICEIKCF